MGRCKRLYPARCRGHLVFSKPRRLITFPTNNTIFPHRDSYMSTASNVRTGKEVIEAILTADTPAKEGEGDEAEERVRRPAGRRGEGCPEGARRTPRGREPFEWRGGEDGTRPIEGDGEGEDGTQVVGEDITGPRDDGEDLPEDEDSTEGEGEDRQGEVFKHDATPSNQEPLIDAEMGRRAGRKSRDSRWISGWSCLGTRKPGSAWNPGKGRPCSTPRKRRRRRRGMSASGPRTPSRSAGRS